MPSGSAAQKKKKPQPYKYAADFFFLDFILDAEETTDTLNTERSDNTSPTGSTEEVGLKAGWKSNPKGGGVRKFSDIPRS